MTWFKHSVFRLVDPLENATSSQSAAQSRAARLIDEAVPLIDLFSEAKEMGPSGSYSIARQAQGRSLSLERLPMTRSGEISVNVIVDAAGDESGYGFRLIYDPAVYLDPEVMVGTAGGSKLCNTNVAGQITCSVSYFARNTPGSTSGQIGEITAGTNQQLITITFRTTSMRKLKTSAIKIISVNATDDMARILPIRRVD
jgi:hypothetical protein